MNELIVKAGFVMQVTQMRTNTTRPEHIVLK